MNAPIIGDCRVCHARGVAVRDFEIYTLCSESTVICHECESAVVEFIRSLARASYRGNKAGYSAAKIVAEAKRTQALVEDAAIAQQQ